jgi:hypothetical protein
VRAWTWSFSTRHCAASPPTAASGVGVDSPRSLRLRRDDQRACSLPR